MRFRDPWGNVVEIVDYRDVQFTKAPAILAALAPQGLDKRAAAREELARKGLTAGSSTSARFVVSTNRTSWSSSSPSIALSSSKRIALVG